MSMKNKEKNINKCNTIKIYFRTIGARIKVSKEQKEIKTY
jgi:hypothetical protein